MERLPDDAAWRWWRHNPPFGIDRVQIRTMPGGDASFLNVKEAPPHWNVENVQWRPAPKPKLVHNKL